MHIAVDGGQHDAPLLEGKGLSLRLGVGGKEVFDLLKARLRRLGRLNHLRQKELALFKVVPHRVQRRNQPLVDDLLRLLRLQQRLHRLPHRFAEALVDGCGNLVRALGGISGNRCTHSGGRRSGRLGGDARDLLRAAEVFDVVRGVLVLGVEHLVGADGVQHRGDVGVDDGQVQPRLQRHQQEAVV